MKTATIRHDFSILDGAVVQYDETADVRSLPTMNGIPTIPVALVSRWRAWSPGHILHVPLTWLNLDAGASTSV